MNHNVPDWNFEGDVSMCNQKKPGGPEHELVELLWRNGQVVLQSQTNRRPSITSNESKQVQKPDHQAIKGDGSYGIPSTLIQDDDTVSWIHYPLEDSFEKEFCSNFFSDLPSSDPIEEEKFVKFGSSDALNGFHNSSQQPKSKPSSTNVTCVEKQMPPPRLQYCNNNSAPQNNNDNNLGELGKVVNFSQFTIPGKGSLRCSSGQLGGKDQSQGGEVRECSIMTVGSSHCGSNQILPEPDMSRASSKVDGTIVGLSAKQLKEDHVHVQKILPQSEGGKKEIVDPTFTSSSGGSGSSFGRTCQQSAGDNNTNNKRKNRDAEESECQSEAAELESAGTKKSSQRSGSSGRSRAAEVHNLSERRRRDRINERMRALQELIPHCTKTDKASLLDEAIEYLKSLQLQLQVMWMGSGMAPMMFPGMQHYMSRMGMGMSPPAMPSIPNPMHMTRVPLADPQTTNHQPVLCPTPVLNPINYQNQMQNTSFPEQYARFMGFHPMQTVSQPINMFSRLGCQTVQQSQSIPQQGISSRPFSGSTTSMHNGLSGKIG